MEPGSHVASAQRCCTELRRHEGYCLKLHVVSHFQLRLPVMRLSLESCEGTAAYHKLLHGLRLEQIPITFVKYFLFRQQRACCARQPRLHNHRVRNEWSAPQESSTFLSLQIANTSYTLRACCNILQSAPSVLFSANAITGLPSAHQCSLPLYLHVG